MKTRHSEIECGYTSVLLWQFLVFNSFAYTRKRFNIRLTQLNNWQCSFLCVVIRLIWVNPLVYFNWQQTASIWNFRLQNHTNYPCHVELLLFLEIPQLMQKYSWIQKKSNKSAFVGWQNQVHQAKPSQLKLQWAIGAKNASEHRLPSVKSRIQKPS